MLLNSNSNAQVTQKAVDSTVGVFKGLYNDGKMPEIYSLLSERSQKLLTKDAFLKAMYQLNTGGGKLGKLEFVKQDGNRYFYRAIFEKMQLCLLVRLNEQNTFETFRFVPVSNVDLAAPIKPEMNEGERVLVKSDSNALVGVITMPANTTNPVPVVLLIAGSGPTDHNCNSLSQGLKTNSYKMLADSLKAAGIACLRYDKRGTGASARALPDESTATFETYVNDATLFMDFLKKDARFSKIYIAGHSEGALTGLLLAEKYQIAGYISIAGAGASVDKVIKTQLLSRSVDLANEFSKLVENVKADKAFKTPDDETLKTLFRPSVLPFLKSWMNYDPAVEIAKLKVPVLVIQGDNDLQVAVSNAESLKRAVPAAHVVIVPKMNHILKNAPYDSEMNYATYTDPELPLNSTLVREIVNFIAP